MIKIWYSEGANDIYKIIEDKSKTYPYITIDTPALVS